MEIYSQSHLTAAQLDVVRAFEKVDVFDAMVPPAVIAEFKTFHNQVLQITITADGMIVHQETNWRK